MENRKRFKTSFITAVLAMAVLGIGYGMSTALRPSQQPAVSVSGNSESPMVPANFSDLAEKARPGVVNIQVVKKVQNVGFAFPNIPGNPFGEDSPFGRFFEGNPSGEQKQEGVGSGFVISQEGYILTNNHVIEDAEQIKVKLANGNEYDAKVVGRDPKTDLALVQNPWCQGSARSTPGQFRRSKSRQLGRGHRKPIRTGADGNTGHR